MKNRYIVLIAEEDPLEQRFIQTTVAGAMTQHESILACGSGRRAVELAKEYHPDLILTDIILPELDGMTAIEEIRGFLPSCCISILSRITDFEYARRAISSKVFAYEQKPIQSAALNALIKQMCKETDMTRINPDMHCEQLFPMGQGREVLLEALTYMKSNFHEKITLEETAAKAFMNPQYFSRIFKRETGFTFSHYVAELRIQRACQLLESTDYPIYRISIECGFSDPSYFNRVFSRFRQVTPQTYRKNLYCCKKSE